MSDRNVSNWFRNNHCGEACCVIAFTHDDQFGAIAHEPLTVQWAAALSRVLVAAAVTAALLVVGALLWSGDPFGWREPQTPAASPAHSAAAAVSEADEVATALEALVQNPADGAAEETRPTVDPDIALPPGSNITPESSTWAPDGIGGGTMNVVLSLEGQPDQRFLAVMVNENGEWKVLATLDQEEATDFP